MIKETIITVDLSDHATLMECYVGLNKSFRKQKERIAELEAALKPFSLQKLSTEPHTTTLMYYTPIGELERQAREIKKRDDEIRAARAALEKK